MLAAHPEARRLLDRRAVAAAGVLTVLVIVVAFTPGLLGGKVAAALHGVRGADPGYLWLGGLGFLCSLLGSAGAWRCSLGLCGGRLTLADANARYGMGSLVNTFLPAHAGGAVRIALFSRTLDTSASDRVWTTGGAATAVGAARAIALAVLVICGAVLGAVPFWPVLILAGLVAAAVVVARRSRNGRARTHVAHALDAFRVLGSHPRSGLRIFAWIAFATAGRILAATAVAAALGVPSPLLAALVIIPAVDVSGLLPLTPGNFGVGSGAVAMALQAHGVGWTQALATGIALQAVQTGTSLFYGTGGLLFLAGGASSGTRRWLLVATATTACMAIGAAFGMTVLVDVV